LRDADPGSGRGIRWRRLDRAPQIYNRSAQDASAHFVIFSRMIENREAIQHPS
jgi:hypothetical protein